MKRPTLDTIAAEIAALTTMTTPQLQVRWKELYRIDPPRHVRAGFLRRAIAHRLQEMVFGTLDPASRRLLHAIARELDRRGRPADEALTSEAQRSPVSLAPGSRLVREWILLHTTGRSVACHQAEASCSRRKSPLRARPNLHLLGRIQV